MLLSQLTQGFDVRGGDREIVGLTEDSRRIEPGMLFVAVPGTAADGHAYIAHAVSRGAAAVVAEREVSVGDNVALVVVASARDALATMAARFYGRPSDGLKLIGFTGTFGKTSTSDILRALLASNGAKPGVLGSLGARYSTFHDPGHGLTTPAPVELHRALRGLSEAGADTVIMEVTSHALRMGRVSGLTFGGGLLAAVMPGEHTDFHRTYEDYVEAKRLFLDHLEPDGVLAFDADNQASRTLASEARVTARSGFSVEGRDVTLTLRDIVLDHTGARFRVDGTRMHSALLGAGHLRNVALALAYALAVGVPMDHARDVLPRLQPLRRRMERYQAHGRTVLDDTAAHPDSLHSTFDVADLLSAGLAAAHPGSRVVVVYAVRGSRGADINRRNALSIADLAEIHRVDSLLLTASADVAGPWDQVQPDEADAATAALRERGRPFQWHDTLGAATRAALDDTKPGDLIVLVGAQGMNEGQALLIGSPPPDERLTPR